MKSSQENPNDGTRTDPHATDSSQGRVKRSFRYIYDRFVRFHGSPREIAWGAALGFFIAMSPTMGIQMYIAIPLAALFRISKLAAATTVWLTNPLTAPFIYGFNYMAGAKLLGYPLRISFTSDPSWQTFWHSGKCVFLSLTVGGIITGVVVGGVGYFLTLSLVTTAREKAHRLKMRHKREE
jgi:uncharacterized protein (DUF2062 family)